MSEGELCHCLCVSLGHSCEHCVQFHDPCCCCCYLSEHHYDPCYCCLPEQSDVYLAISEPEEETVILAAKDNAKAKMK